MPSVEAQGLLANDFNMVDMGDTEYIDKEIAEQHSGDETAPGMDDAGAIPKGQIDPVYEAKARVLNRAVSKAEAEMHLPSFSNNQSDPGYRHGLVSMATFHRRGFWLGQRQPMADCHISHLHADYERIQSDKTSTPHPSPEHRLAVRRHVLGVWLRRLRTEMGL